MKSKFIVNIFISIVAAIGIKGFFCIKQIDSKLGSKIQDQKDLMNRISEVQDWYSIVVTENLIKYCHSIYSFKDFQENVSRNRRVKNESLKNFYSSEPISNQEFLFGENLRKEDVKVDEFLDRVLKLDKRPTFQSIFEMYQIMTPAVEASKEIIKLKDSYLKSHTTQLHQSIVDFEMFLLLAAAFSAAMFIAYNAPKSCETSSIIGEKLTKSLPKKPKPPVKKIKITNKHLKS